MPDSFELVFLGCGDAFASGGRFNTCFYVAAPSARFLIDCGASSLVALHRHGLTSDDIDAVLITHFHGDHYGGLPFLLLEAAKERARRRRLTVVTPPGGERRTRELMEQLYPGMSGALDGLDLHFVEYTARRALDLDWGRVVAYPVVHSDAAQSHGLRVTVDGRVIGFSGDTAWTEELVEIADGADLMICECNFLDTQAPNHLDYRTLERHADRLRAGRIVLNHLSDEMLAHRGQSRFRCAEDGLKLDL